jgi:hypothetical protein
MIISEVTNAPQNPPAAQSKPVNQEPRQPKPQPTNADSVMLSTSAKAMLAEANETAAQTTREASRGDMQAQRLIARKAELKGPMEKSAFSELV